MFAVIMVRIFVALLFSSAVLAQAQEIGGVGIALAQNKDTKELSVHKVIPESPAAKSGIKPGQIIQAIGGVPVKGKSLADCVALIRGPAGSQVTLELADRAANKTNKLELTRAAMAAINANARAKIGDPAAPLALKEWLKGRPVDVTDGTKIYVVEFWATWCGPCRVSIPHLTKVAKKYEDKGVVLVGISDEKPEVVKPFVEKMGSQMDYRIACDDQQKTSRAYMEAYGQTGIPTAFIVDRKGKIAWVGHPMAGLDKKLDELTKQ